MNRAIESEQLTRRTFRRALKYLSDRDPDLARVIDDYGHPPMWLRKPGFSTLVYIILAQQVSLASARATFDRLCEAACPLTPYRFLALDDTALNAIGFSRQKTYYCRQLSQAIRQKELKLSEIENMDNKTARSELTKIKGRPLDCGHLLAYGAPQAGYLAEHGSCAGCGDAETKEDSRSARCR